MPIRRPIDPGLPPRNLRNTLVGVLRGRPSRRVLQAAPPDPFPIGGPLPGQLDGYFPPPRIRPSFIPPDPFPAGDVGAPGLRPSRFYDPSRTLIEAPGIWPAPPGFRLPQAAAPPDFTALIANMARLARARQDLAAGRMF